MHLLTVFFIVAAGVCNAACNLESLKGRYSYYAVGIQDSVFVPGTTVPKAEIGSVVFNGKGGAVGWVKGATNYNFYQGSIGWTYTVTTGHACLITFNEEEEPLAFGWIGVDKNLYITRNGTKTALEFTFFPAPAKCAAAQVEGRYAFTSRGLNKTHGAYAYSAYEAYNVKGQQTAGQYFLAQTGLSESVSQHITVSADCDMTFSDGYYGAIHNSGFTFVNSGPGMIEAASELKI